VELFSRRLLSEFDDAVIRVTMMEEAFSDGRPNFTLKLVRPGFGPAAELPASSPA
jgi:hypothetical protein